MKIFILAFLLLTGLSACKKQKNNTPTDSALITDTAVSSDDDGGDLFTWDDEGIKPIEKWAPTSFAGLPLDSISRAMYDHLDVYALSMFYKNGKQLVKLTILDAEDEYVEPFITSIQYAFDNDIVVDTLGRQSKVVSKKGIKAIESVEENTRGISLIHKNRYVLIASGNIELNKLWDGVAGLPLNKLK